MPGWDLITLEEGDQLVIGQEPEAWTERIHVGVGRYPGGIGQHLLTPNKPGLDTQVDDLFEEATEEGQSAALAQPCACCGVRQRLIQLVAAVPAQGCPLGRSGRRRA